MALTISLETLMPFAQERRSWSCHFPACALLPHVAFISNRALQQRFFSPSDAIFAPGASFQTLFLLLPWLHCKASLLFRAKRGGKSAKGIFFPRRLSARGEEKVNWLVKRGAKSGLRHAVDATKMDAAYFSFPDQNFAIESFIIF